MGSIKNILVSTYFAAWLAALIWYPLVARHGYRQWWLVTFYVIMAVTTVAGSISHYRTGRRNNRS